MANSNDLLGSLVQQLGGNGIAEIARSAGVSGGDVTKVIGGALPAMMAGLTRNTASSSGAVSARARSARAAAVISPTVSPLVRSATRRAVI